MALCLGPIKLGNCSGASTSEADLAQAKINASLGLATIQQKEAIALAEAKTLQQKQRQEYFEQVVPYVIGGIVVIVILWFLFKKVF